MRASPAAAALALLLAGTSAQATETFELWTELGVRLAPLPRLRIDVQNLLRFDFQGRVRELPQVSVDYRVWRPLRVGGGYRFLFYSNGDDPSETGNQVYGQAMLDLDRGRFELGARSRVQYRVVTDSTGADREPNAYLYWRNRVSGSWAFRRPLGVQVSVEEFLRLDGGARHDRVRVEAGLFARWEAWRVDLSYMREFRVGPDYPYRNVVEVSLRWSPELRRRPSR
ncbi:MAG: DUF2490 domain-containing protein [Deltaproteobacteria bacterium]|nr:DUF2490 domain-containing protein [Deltaproteobacteria bacterium]